MFKLKLYKYDSNQETNGYRGVGENDFSNFVALGEDLSEDISQVMDTAEITLYGLPIKKSFDPETKFILDIVEYNAIQQDTIVKTVHLIVSRDTVNQPILSNNNYFDHHISFIESSVVAQKRLVDNISATYKLKDVSLKAVPAYPAGEITVQNTPSQFTPLQNFAINTNYNERRTSIYIGKYFEIEGNLRLLSADGTPLSQEYISLSNFGTEEEKFAQFELPQMAIYGGINGTRSFQKLGYASIDYLIEEFEPNDLYNPLNTFRGSIITNDNLYRENSVVAPFPRNQAINQRSEWLVEITNKTGGSFTAEADEYFERYQLRKYTDINAETPVYRTALFPIRGDKRYSIKIYLHEFEDSLNIYDIGTPDSYYYTKYTRSQPTQTSQSKRSGNFNFPSSGNSYVSMAEANTTVSTTYFVYNDNTDTEIVYSSSVPYSALALLQKAIINSGLYEKQDGVYIADVNKSNLPFYIDPDFEDELKSTLIIESFYNQKNLWEIMIEVGNYIHAIPELKFGSNDRFVVTFNRLGRTDEKQNNSTKVSVFNSRSVEDYISATSSYITNMVQLGGYIEEWVAPKTTNEQLLVSNDTADILTSKPIIELLSIQVRRNSDGAIADLTNFIYEENVYKTLSIDYDVVPNRGAALYYKLGTNIITGSNYQLPQANTNIYSDYTIKKAIWSAFNGYPSISPAPVFGYWTDLKVNDYSFFVRYRTKDSVRQNHIRPDLRKYLLNSKWDKYPEHNQFNNQTDVVVDSTKFGNNMFGKLIRTGNNSYEICEWNDTWEHLKHKGELYRLDGELYYVAKVMHTIYESHIISEISYSKDYNELSNIIGIPSEPRFYEISEQSLIWRDFEINDVLLLTDDQEQIQYKSNYINNYDHLANLIVGEGIDFAKYAVTVFKGDKDAGKYDQTVGQSDLYIEIINPINAYSSENTLTYEYDMEDNYSAGDQVITTEQLIERLDDDGNVLPLSEGSYNSLWAVKYTDIYGKAPLMDFYILSNIGIANSSSPSENTPPTPDETRAFPESPISTKKNDTRPYIGNYDILATNVKEYDTNFNGRGLGLLKDCREAISINYNLRMVTSSDTFVLSPYVFLPKKSNIRVVLLAEEVNKLSTGYIDNSEIITPINKQGTSMNPYFSIEIDKSKTQTSSWNNEKQVVTQFEVNMSNIFAEVSDKHFTGEDGVQRVKSIAILCDVSLNSGFETQNPSIPYKTQFIVARNIPEDFTREQSLKSWIWGAPKNDKLFKNKQ